MGETIYPRPVPPGTVDKSNWGLRYGSSDPKGLGFLGVLGRPDGGVSSELSIGVNIDGKDIEVPSMVPSLTPQQRQTLLSLRDGQPMPQDIVDAAVMFAKTRIAKGLSPFASDAESPDNVSLDDVYARQKNNYEAMPQPAKANLMGDVYKGIDFERMLSDLGQALERNKPDAQPRPAEQPAATAATPGIPTARFPDVPQGVPPVGAQSVPAMTVGGGGPLAPISPQDAQTSAQLDAAAPGAIAFGGGHAPPPPMSPQDMQTMAMLNAATPDAVAFGGGYAPHPAHAPPPAIAAQLAGAAAAPTAMSLPPTQYPNIDPNDAGGLAGYAALQR